MTTNISDWVRDRDDQAASEDFLADLDTDDLAFARDAIAFAEDCERSDYDGHAEDMLDPIHGTDLDPCALCQPTDEYDIAVAGVLDLIREERDALLFNAA